MIIEIVLIFQLLIFFNIIFQAIEFRKFWNKKSELRRFQDGTIREAVIWSKGKTLSGKRIICKKIITFLLTKKLGFPKNKFTYIADQIEELIKLQKVTIYSKIIINFNLINKLSFFTIFRSK